MEYEFAGETIWQATFDNRSALEKLLHCRGRNWLVIGWSQATLLGYLPSLSPEQRTVHHRRDRINNAILILRQRGEDLFDPGKMGSSRFRSVGVGKKRTLASTGFAAPPGWLARFDTMGIPSSHPVFITHEAHGSKAMPFDPVS